MDTGCVVTCNNESDISRELQDSAKLGETVAEALAEQLRRTPGVTVLPLQSMAAAYVRAVLAACGGNKMRAARALGIDRRSIYRWLAKAE